MTRLTPLRRSPTYTVTALRSMHLPDGLDPFLQLDHFRMAGPTCTGQPLAGCCVLTYLFLDSPGSLQQRDSLGGRVLLLPGDLHWLTAGRGVVHEEVPSADGVVCHGLQVFVNLSAAQKLLPPTARHLPASAVPRVLVDGVSSASGVVRVLCGGHGDMTSPLVLPTAVTLLDLTLPAGAVFTHALPNDERAFGYVLAGAVVCGERSIGAGQAFSVSEQPGEVHLSADTDAHLLLAHGRPLREPLLAHGPFVMNTRAQLVQAFADHGAGLMGRV